jgi:large subunit ribosomal protein L13
MERESGMKTEFVRQQDCPTDRRDWYVVDATDQVLGRLAVRIAHVMKGKDRPDYTPHVDMSPYVVVTNASKVKVTGRKLTTKLYQHHTGYIGGLRTTPLSEMLEKHPTEVIRLAVKRMLPRNKLGRQIMRKLKIYAGPDHPHTYAKPQPLP